jgi:O-antigen/teichoic acid export membrane protein
MNSGPAERRLSVAIPMATHRLRLLSAGTLNLNLLLLAGGELLTRALTFLAFSYLSRALQPEAFGKLEVGMAVLMFGFIAVELGYKTVGAKLVAQHPGEADSLIARVVPSQTLIALFVLALVAIATWTLQLDVELERLLLGLASTLIVVPWFLSWVFQGQQRMVWITLPQVVRQLIFLFVVLLLVRQPNDLRYLPWAEWSGVLAAAAICVAVQRASGARLTLRWREPLDAKLLISSLPIGVSLLTWAMRNFFPIILLGFMVTDAEVGYFGVGTRLLMALQVGVMVYWTNYFPRLSQLAQGSLAVLRRHLRFSTGLLTCAMLAVALFFYWQAEPVLRLVFGQSFADPRAVAALQTLVWILPVAAWRSHGTYALFVVNRQSLELICSLVGIGLLLGLALGLTPRFGGLGMAWAMLLAEGAGGLLVWLAWGWTVRQVGRSSLHVPE